MCSSTTRVFLACFALLQSELSAFKKPLTLPTIVMTPQERRDRTDAERARDLDRERQEDNALLVTE